MQWNDNCKTGAGKEALVVTRRVAGARVVCNKEQPPQKQSTQQR